LRFLLCVLTLLIVPACSLAARGDVIYTINAVGAGSPGSPLWGVYSFSEPSILTSSTIIDSAQLLSSSGAPLRFIGISPTVGTCPTGFASSGAHSCFEIQCVGSDTFEFRCGPGGSGLGVTLSEELLTFGTYGSTGPHGISLTIAEGPSIVPEPSAFVLFATGILCIVGSARRKLRSW
jgi:hypothetical protein